MKAFPSFDVAVDGFKEFLSANEIPTAIQWVFREQMYEKRGAFFVAVPLPHSNTEIAARAYDHGVRQEQIAISAVATFADKAAATIWFPVTEQDRPQGWENGLRYTIRQPLHLVRELPVGWRWSLHQMSRAFRRYHSFSGHSILSMDEIA